MSSVKQQILDELRRKLEGLKTALGVSYVQRRRDVRSESKDRSLEYIVGTDVVTEWDSVGFTIQFPLNIKLTWRTESSGYDKGEELKALIQAEMEKDFQLGGLANVIDFDGEADFSKDDNWSSGCLVLAYTVEYRRRRGEPDKSY